MESETQAKRGPGGVVGRNTVSVGPTRSLDISAPEMVTRRIARDPKLIRM